MNVWASQGLCIYRSYLLFLRSFGLVASKAYFVAKGNGVCLRNLQFHRAWEDTTPPYRAPLKRGIGSLTGEWLGNLKTVFKEGDKERTNCYSCHSRPNGNDSCKPFGHKDDFIFQTQVFNNWRN